MVGNGGGNYEGLLEGIDYESRRPHHENFDEALQKAVDAIPDGPPEWFTVELQVRVRHSSPGWVDGYKVTLRPGG